MPKTPKATKARRTGGLSPRRRHLVSVSAGATASSKLLQSREMQDKLKKVRILMLDVDGIMTDGRIFWLESHGWVRHFHAKDGYGLKRLAHAGIQIAVISGGDSKDVRRRMEDLKIHYVFLGDEDKLKAFEKIRESTGFKPEQMAFMGDDLYDLPVLEKVGFSATVPDAMEAVKATVDYVTETPGGWGAVREIADAILETKDSV